MFIFKPTAIWQPDTDLNSFEDGRLTKWLFRRLKVVQFA